MVSLVQGSTHLLQDIQVDLCVQPQPKGKAVGGGMTCLLLLINENFIIIAGKLVCITLGTSLVQ